MDTNVLVKNSKVLTTREKQESFDRWSFLFSPAGRQITICIMVHSKLFRNNFLKDLPKIGVQTTVPNIPVIYFEPCFTFRQYWKKVTATLLHPMSIRKWSTLHLCILQCNFVVLSNCVSTIPLFIDYFLNVVPQENQKKLELE